MDTFESFKILLNMLEMLNYFYILIQISYQEWDVSSIIQQQSNELMKGTFGSWIRIRVFLSGEKQRKKILGNPKLNNKVKCFETMMESKIYICELINRLYQMIGVEKQCSNDINNLTLRASFEEMSKFRTYTRGHGVYTFTITDELNLSIMEIVKCWFLKLDENGLLEDDYSNLEQLGWILEYKNKMYFVYSYIKETDELEYHCFPDGTGLYLPYDIVE